MVSGLIRLSRGVMSNMNRKSEYFFLNLKQIFILFFFLLFDFSEATETRHALHGVRWPTSNPKLLNVDFGTEGGMEKALQSTVNDVLKTPGERSRDDFVSWDRDRIEMEEKKVCFFFRKFF